MRTLQIVLNCSPRWRWAAWSAAGLALVLSAQPAVAQNDRSNAVRFVDGLRQRRLYELADRFCRAELAYLAATGGSPIDLALQWIQVHVDRARRAVGTERDAAWETAHQVARSCRELFPNSPRVVLVDLQEALATVAQAETLRDEWERTPQQTSLQNQASALWLRAVRELDQVARHIETGRARAEPSATPEHIGLPQWLALANHVALEQARCFQGLATLHSDEERTARIDALARVDRQIQELLTRISADDPLWWDAQLLRSECLRWLGQPEVARGLWESTQPDSVPTTTQAAWWREQIRLAIAIDRTQELIPRLAEIEPFLPRDPELGVALIEWYLAAAAAAADAEERLRWQQRAAEQIAAIRTYHGEYWSQRAGRVAASSLPADVAATPHALVGHLADEALRRGDPDEAIRLLDLAAERASAQPDLGVTFDLAFRAAAIEQQQRRWDTAADRFRLLATAFPEHPRAAEAHLLCAWNMAQNLGTDPARLEQYLAALQSQIERWPTAAATHEAAIWLAPILRQRRAEAAALEALVRVPPASPLFVQAWPLAQAVCRDWLRRATATSSENPREIAEKICERLAGWSALEANSTEELAASVQAMALLELQIRLAYLDVELDSIHRQAVQLASTFRAAGREADALLAEATGHLASVVSAAEDLPLPTNQAKVPTDELWLVAWRRYSQGDRAPALAEWLLALTSADRNFLESVPVPDRQAWRLAIAESRWRNDDQAGAMEMLTQLIDDFPRDLALRQAIARLLSPSAEPKPAELALATWRTIAAGTPPQSDAWFEAKYQIARLLHATGATAEAEKMLRYLQAVPPGWTTSNLANEFEALLRDVSR